jgi:hypothetical protein
MVPAMAFFGGLGDLLVTTVMGDWPHISLEPRHEPRTTRFA